MAAETTSVRTPRGHVLVVSEDPLLRDHVVEWLGDELAVHGASSSAEALEDAARRDCDLVLLDAEMAEEPAADALRRLRERFPGTSVVAISGPDGDGVDEVMDLGAVEYVTRPVQCEKLRATVGLALRAHRLELENRRLVEQLQVMQWGHGLVGCSPAIRRLAGVLSRVAQTDATVLIEGKPGSGKSLAARIIHAGGPRADAPLVTVHGETLTEEALRAQLQEAAGGTLLLEDAERLPAPTQALLVRHLKERPSSGAPGSVRVRVIATTSARLPELVARGDFREDLFYRLNVYPVRVPSLHERREDIMLLATHLLKQSADQTDLPDKGFTPAAIILLETHPWPGNVAQLQNAVFRAHALAGGGAIDRIHLLGPSTGLTMDVGVTADALEAREEEDDEEVTEHDIQPLEVEEKRLLGRALKATGGNVRRAAQLLRTGRATLYRKIQVYKLRLH